MAHTVKTLSDHIQEHWGDRIDGAVEYATRGCMTAPPEFCQVSADFFYDLLMLAKRVATENGR